MELNHYEMERSWVKTDDLQWRLQLNSTTFYLVEIRKVRNTYVGVSEIIDTETYTEKDVRSYIKSYGYKSINDMEKTYGDDVMGIIAECLFEDMSLTELPVYGKYSTIEQAVQGAEEFMHYVEKIELQSI